MTLSPDKTAPSSRLLVTWIVTSSAISFVLSVTAYMQHDPAKNGSVPLVASMMSVVALTVSLRLRSRMR